MKVSNKALFYNSILSSVGDKFDSVHISPKKQKGTYESIRTEPKIGRNDPCPCGSRKKYKKCCGK